jgi:hypothetical protein
MAEQGENIETKKQSPMHTAYADAMQTPIKVIERPGAPPMQTNSNFTETGKENVKMTLENPSFITFAKDAYKAKENYAIRINPITGEKEMFIAGSHSPFTRKGVGQWALNLWDVPIALLEHPSDEWFLGPEMKWADEAIKYGRDRGYDPIGWLDPWRRRSTKKFERIARDQGVDVIYGHSRGGAIVADMHVPKGTKKVGLDAAMLLAGNRAMLNYKEDQVFDEIIATSGQHNETFDVGPKFHQVWN